jgi:membrane-associated phospholipid phosphatase
MCEKIASVRSISRAVALCAFLTLSAAASSAQNLSGDTLPQTQPQPAPKAQPSPSPTPAAQRSFFRNILRDQRAIWTSPFRMERGDAKWLVPLGLASAALFATDHRTASALVDSGDSQTRLRISRDVSYAGSLYATGGIAAAFYLAGRAGGNARARETGVLAAEALIDSHIVVEGLKAASLRNRPRFDDASGEFFDGGSSFPSGHATGAWSLATVVANEYKHQRFVQVAAYGLAAAVSVSRFTGEKHFLSDVLVGSAIGYGVGRYVYRTHHDASLDTGEAAKPGSTHSKLTPFISPRFSRAAHVYGLELAWNF